jgi:hypothetical protein
MNKQTVPLTIAEPFPTPVGWWKLPGGTATYYTKFSCAVKPNWLVRLSMRYVFGWLYEDEL